MESLTPDLLLSPSFLLTKSPSLLASDFLNHLKSLASSKKFLIAYSGGLDSHVLLHLMSQIPAIKVRAMHVHHGLLDEADSWVKHCEKICSELKIPLQTKYLGLVIKQGESLEEMARIARYKVLRESLKDDEVLLTAHHQNDQTETLLLQLFRGAGVNGLAAMPQKVNFAQKGKKGGRCASLRQAQDKPSPISSSAFIRPLLKESRQSLESYANKHQLEFIEDPSNSDTSFDRNFLRKEVLPLLRQRWKGIDKSINRSASIQAETKNLLDELAEQDLAVVLSYDSITIELEQLLELSLARQKLVIRYWIKQSGFLSPSEKKLKHVLNDVIYAKEDAQPVVDWEGAELRRFNNQLYIMSPLLAHDSSQVIFWDISKPLEIKPLGLSLDFQSLSIYEDMLQDDLVTIRFRQGGEKLFIPQRGIHISLKNLMNESKVPPWLRPRLPLVYVNEKLVKVIGLADDE